jgi:hypothetical protein
MALIVSRQEESSMLERLLPEIMMKVLECLDVASRMRLAGMNRLLQRIVYEECRLAWAEISFCNEDTHSCELRKRLTDYQLARLLIRVDARNVTVRLCLRGCDQIQGYGLAPMWNSRVWERLDMKFSKVIERKNLENFLGRW